MPAETKKEIELEIAYVLFVDIVGYSKLVTSEQRRLLELLNQIVRECEHFRAAEAKSRLIYGCRPVTGWRWFSTILRTPQWTARLRSASAASEHPELKLRMGIHSGPVSGWSDVSGRSNIAGAGINIAQRVMDCGDAGHILVSKHVAEDLEQYGQWKRHLHDLGECEVKHGVRVSVVNLYTEDHGNPEVPQKFQQAKAKDRSNIRGKPAGRSRGMDRCANHRCGSRRRGGFYIFSHRSGSTAPPSAAHRRQQQVIPEKSIAVLPFENLSEDKANAYFADGIQDEILTRLAKIADLKVISRTSTQHYQERARQSARDRQTAWRGPHPGRKRAKERRLRARERAANQSSE